MHGKFFLKNYLIYEHNNRIYMWRKALASLKGDAALLIACGNANTYFKIGIKCLKERK